MTIDGIEIQQLKTTVLLKHLKTFTVMIPLYFAFSIFFGVVGIGLLLNLPMEEMWMVPIMGIVGCVIFFAVGVSLVRKVKEMKATLRTRTITADEKAAADSSFKKLLIACIMIIVVCSLVFSTLVISGIQDSSSSHSSGSSSVCRICGRDRNIVAGFNMCYECYEGFTDWQKDN